MLFSALYKPRSPSEEAEKRSLQLFMSWQPPFEFKAHYARGDGEGGIAIIEADTAEQVIEGIAPWVPFFTFEVTPVVSIENAVPLFVKANEWRDSVR